MLGFSKYVGKFGKQEQIQFPGLCLCQMEFELGGSVAQVPYLLFSMATRSSSSMKMRL
jgi:hypothetical protein